MPNEEYLLYQTLVGAWPFDAEPDEAGFVDRIDAYMTKAMREAKVHTSWLNPDEEYEAAVLEFVDAILDPRSGRSCRRSARSRRASPSSGSTTAWRSC